MAGFVSERYGDLLAEGMGARAASLIPSHQSDGRLFVFHYVAPPGFPGPALHRHSELDETFYVLDGTLTVQVDDQRHDVGAGQAAFVPRGAAHGFGNATGAPVAFIGVANPAGQIEDMLAEIGRYVAAAGGQADPQKLGEINARFGVEMLGPPILAGVPKKSS